MNKMGCLNVIGAFSRLIGLSLLFEMQRRVDDSPAFLSRDFFCLAFPILYKTIKLPQNIQAAINTVFQHLEEFKDNDISLVFLLGKGF